MTQSATTSPSTSPAESKSVYQYISGYTLVITCLELSCENRTTSDCELIANKELEDILYVEGHFKVNYLNALLIQFILLYCLKLLIRLNIILQIKYLNKNKIELKENIYYFKN